MYDKLGKLLKLSSIPDAALQQAPSDISCLLEEKTRFPAGRQAAADPVRSQPSYGDRCTSSRRPPCPLRHGRIIVSPSRSRLASGSVPALAPAQIHP